MTKTTGVQGRPEKGVLLELVRGPEVWAVDIARVSCWLAVCPPPWPGADVTEGLSRWPDPGSAG